jgi:AcrR family transcriptional regulator
LSNEREGQADLRVRRTRESLWGALLSLMEEKGYAAVTVSDLARRARVNRATFYLHYEDKDDLFRRGCAVMVEEIIRRLGPPTVELDKGFSWLPSYTARLFAEIEGQRSAFRTLLGPKGNPEAQAIADDLIYSFLFEERLRLVLPESDRKASSALIYARAMTSMILGLTTWWIRSGEGIGAEDLAQTYASIALSIVGSITEIIEGGKS